MIDTASPAEIAWVTLTILALAGNLAGLADAVRDERRRAAADQNGGVRLATRWSVFSNSVMVWVQSLFLAAGLIAASTSTEPPPGARTTILSLFLLVQVTLVVMTVAQRQHRRALIGHYTHQEQGVAHYDSIINEVRQNRVLIEGARVEASSAVVAATRARDEATAAQVAATLAQVEATAAEQSAAAARDEATAAHGAAQQIIQRIDVATRGAQAAQTAATVAQVEATAAQHEASGARNEATAAHGAAQEIIERIDEATRNGGDA